MFKSPLNYVGGKYKLLPEILPKFPSIENRFIDLFCGGANVAINVKAKKFVLNDVCKPLIELYGYIRDRSVAEVLGEINKFIMDFKISKTNQEGYLALRDSYNKEPHPIKFLVLISNSFNHQIRFNSKGEFNMPFGKDRSFFNETMQKNLTDLMHVFHSNEFVFECEDFRFVYPQPDDFVYADPPYTMSTAVYNTGWGQKDDEDLCLYLDYFSMRGGKFALSCVLEHNQKSNDQLKNWAKKYKTHVLEWKYKNSNYHKKDRSGGIEALIVNYEV